MEQEIERISSLKEKPSLLLHACCAPCSSYVVELLKNYFRITIYFYNPNIYPKKEHDRRLDELKTFLAKFESSIKIIEEEYSPLEFTSYISGLENEKEGGARCFKCYDLRLSKTALKANGSKFDYFTTTLSISPHKNASKINEIGKNLSEIYDVKFLHSDFKKKNGFKRSTKISNEFNLYRQDYCGCEYSIRNELPE